MPPLSAVRSRTNRQLALVFGAFGLGLAGVLGGIMILDSRGFVGFAVAWIIAVILIAKRWFRCPLCNASILLAPVSESLPWILGRTRRCPRCRADYDEAKAAVLAGSRTTG
jgi:hypothetical protein